MPPKSKAKTNKEDENKNLAKSEKRLTVDKGRKSKQMQATNEKVQEQGARKSSNISQLEMGRSTEKISLKEAEVSEEISTQKVSGAKKIQIAPDDTWLKLLYEVVDLDDSSLEPEPEDYEYDYDDQNRQKSFVADTEQLMLEIPSMPEPEEAIEDESSDEDMPQYLKQVPLEEEADFFGNIADDVDIDKLSMDISVENVKTPEKPKPIPKAKPAVEGDVGKFVHPITGEALVFKEPKEEKKIIIVVEKPKPVVVDEPVMIGGRVLIEVKVLPPASDDEVSIDILSDQEKEDEATKVVAEEDTFNQFLGLDAAGPLETVEEIDVEAMLSAENARILRIQTYEFIQYLIKMAVEKAEYVDPTIILRQNLDKRKLMKELREKLQVLEVERRGKRFLNHKCVEYFRRKRTFRPILQDNPKTLQIEYHKYQEAMASLDQWLIREEEAQTITQKNLEVVRAQLLVENARSQKEVTKLEEVMSKTLKRENFDKLQQVVTRALNQMELKRQEISDVRLQLIQKQHNRATLVEQLHTLEDLGNGLNMRDFEAVQTDTQALDKKIEERNAELNKLRIRCHGDIHRMSHHIEKQSMLLENIAQQRQLIDQLQLEKQNLREFIYKLKIDRNRLRKEIRDTSFQSGLLDNPVLMKDYDTTIEYVENLKSRIESSQVSIKTINAKIKFLEQHCNNE